jgi:hypothetical protein
LSPTSRDRNSSGHKGQLVAPDELEGILVPYSGVADAAVLGASMHDECRREVNMKVLGGLSVMRPGRQDGRPHVPAHPAVPVVSSRIPEFRQLREGVRFSRRCDGEIVERGPALLWMEQDADSTGRIALSDTVPDHVSVSTAHDSLFLSPICRSGIRSRATVTQVTISVASSRSSACGTPPCTQCIHESNVPHHPMTVSIVCRVEGPIGSGSL